MTDVDTTFDFDSADGALVRNLQEAATKRGSRLYRHDWTAEDILIDGFGKLSESYIPRMMELPLAVPRSPKSVLEMDWHDWNTRTKDGEEPYADPEDRP